MTEDDARKWITDRFGDHAFAQLEKFVAVVREEAPRQNLVSASSLEAIWARHIVDSAQLLDHAAPVGLWVDIGTGAGFPGVVIAALTDRDVILIEPRRRRVEFLRRALYELDLGSRVIVEQAKVESINYQASVISARAVASIDAVLSGAAHCATRKTRWVLPKGRNALEEVAQAKASWHGVFHVEQSITDPSSLIVVANGVSRR